MDMVNARVTFGTGVLSSCVFICSLFFGGCAEPEAGLHFIGELERWETVRVEYQRTADDVFTSSDSLFLTVVFLGFEGNLIARYTPTDDAGGLLTFTFDVPGSAEYVRCILSPREQPLQSVEVSGLVLANGIPVPGAEIYPNFVDEGLLAAS
jgi:hypothetical protein